MMSETPNVRDRVTYFRTRWARENFTSQTALPALQDDLQQDKLAQRESSLLAARRLQPVPWLKSFSRSTQDYFNNHSTLSHGSSVRSPVDSEGYTIFSGPAQQQTMSSDSERQEKPEQNPPSSKSSWLNEIYILCWLAFFSMLGTLARVGVEAITQYPDEVVTSRVLWANLGGSFFMGFLVEDSNLFGLPDHLAPQGGDDEVDEPARAAVHLKHKKSIPMYIGLTTGFCGSFTSFSSFIRDAFLALTNDLPSASPTTPYHAPTYAPYPRNGGFSVLALLAILVLHPAVSLAALRVGAHIAMLSRSVFKARVAIRPRFRTGFMDPLIAVVTIGCFLGALFLTIFPPSSGPSAVNWRARATIPLLWAPLGCFLRYYLSKYLNTPARPNFPLGTFLANVIGTFVLGMAFDLQHARGIGAVLGVGNGNSCAVLLGVEEGFCGCLSTVSTWVVELYGLRLKSAWVYGLTSVSVALAGMVVIMGSVGWTSGFQTPVCG